MAQGRVVFEGRPAQHTYNLQGTVHGGWAATLLDSAMGCAVISTMPPGRSHTTTELSIRYVRALTVATGPVRAEAVVLHVGRRLATAEGRMIGVADGKLYAHGQTSCMVLDVSAGGQTGRRGQSGLPFAQVALLFQSGTEVTDILALACFTWRE